MLFLLGLTAKRHFISDRFLSDPISSRVSWSWITYSQNTPECSLLYCSNYYFCKMSWLRCCGTLRNQFAQKPFLASFKDLNFLQRPIRTVATQALKQPSKICPFIIKCSVFGVSGYLSFRYLPTAKCRQAREEDSQHHTFKTPENIKEPNRVADKFPLSQFLG